MITRLALASSVRDDLFAHAREGALATERDDQPESDPRAAPEEVCGVLAGERRTAEADAADSDDADADDNMDASDDTDAGDDTDGDDYMEAGDDADAEIAVVTDCRRVPNVADRPSARYELDPAATVDAIEALETAELDHVGFYHSHPRGPRGPSRTDQAQATWPGYVYLIVSLGSDGSPESDAAPSADPVIGAWRWTGESFVQLPIEVVEP